MVENFYRYNKIPFGSATANFGMAVNQNPNNVSTNPAMGAQVDPQVLKEVAEDNFIGNRINAYGEIDHLTQLGLSVPVAIAINAGMDKYLKLYDGEYSKSLAGKIGNFGDKVSNLISENPVGRFLGTVKDKMSSYWKTYVYDKSLLIRTYGKTSTSPELQLAKNQMHMAKDMPLQQYFNAAEEFINKPITCVKDLDAIGASASDIQRIQSLVEAAPNEAAANKILLEEQYKLLKPNATAMERARFSLAESSRQQNILKNLKAQALEWKNINEFELAKKDPLKNGSKVLQKLERMKNRNLFARIDWSDKNTLSKARGFLTGRKLTFNQIRNILISSSGKENVMHSTALGRSLNKWVNLVSEGLTGRMFNGKLSTLMQAFFVAEALLMASKQDTAGDKFKSFMERMTELAGFFIFAGPSINLMHKVGGWLKNSGMTPEQVKIYEQAVIEFNKRVEAGFYKSKKSYKFGRLRLKALYRPKTKNPLIWLGRKVGDFVSTGLKTTIRPYSRFKQKEVNLCVTELKNPVQYFKNIPHRLKDIACNPKYWTKRFAGWPIRFAIPMMLILPFFNKIAVKGCHTIFGKPKYSLLDQEKYEKEQEKIEEAKRAAEEANNVQQQSQQPGQEIPVKPEAKIPEIKPKDPNSYKSDSNLIKVKMNGGNVNERNGETVRTYIPSPEPAATVAPDTSGLDKTFADADRIEQEIQSVLKMK